MKKKKQKFQKKKKNIFQYLVLKRIKMIVKIKQIKYVIL